MDDRRVKQIDGGVRHLDRICSWHNHEVFIGLMNTRKDMIITIEKENKVFAVCFVYHLNDVTNFIGF